MAVLIMIKIGTLLHNFYYDQYRAKDVRYRSKIYIICGLPYKICKKILPITSLSKKYVWEPSWFALYLQNICFTLFVMMFI